MRKSGFTVIEMMVTLSILTITLSIGVPGFKDISRGSEMVANSSDMLSALNFARIEAVKRGKSVWLSQKDGATWSGGLVVWEDNDGDGGRNSGEELRLWEDFNAGSSVLSANSVTDFVFAASGEVNNDDQLTLCDTRSGETGRVISILRSGAAFAEKVSCE